MIEEMPIGARMNRNLGNPTAPGESVEQELTAFIEKRDKQRRQTEGERATEEAWAESQRRYNARRREENRLAWHAYFCRLALFLRTRADEYDQRAKTLLETDGKDAA